MHDTEKFWQWFSANNERLTMLGDLTDAERKALLALLQKQLDDYCEGLSFVMGEPTPSGRTLTFTAEGDNDLFRYVVALTDSAPDLDWWDFVAFKQAAGTSLRVRFDRFLFDTTKMHFMQLECEDEPDFIGLRVAVDMKHVAVDGKPVSSDDEDLQVGVYVTIEAMIGEFDCATLMGYLEVVPLPEEPFKAGFRPMDDLPDFVQWFKKQRDKE
ncbi:MAG: hypothetical protein IJR13_03480 [Bacteroidales bacterium]|nr:hypothetical protein [Bacteroidales bacterium]